MPRTAAAVAAVAEQKSAAVRAKAAAVAADKKRVAARANAAKAAETAANQQAQQAPAFVGGSGDTYCQNCTAVRAAGKDPIYQGQPGYSRKLDRDGDGIACER